MPADCVKKNILQQGQVFDYSLQDSSICFVISQDVTSTVNVLISSSVSTSISLYCGKNSHLTIRLIILFPDHAEITLHTFLCGDNAQVRILGMSALTDNQNVLIKTQQIHCGKNSSSKLLLQGLVAEKARFLYEGTIRIEEQASGTYALHHNKNILLSKTSTAI